MTAEDAIKMLKSKMDGHTDTSYEWAETVRMAIKALEQEPFINKPCVSSGVCGHDKNKILDKIRAELHATAEMHSDGDYYLREEWIDEITDKYMECEDKE